MKNFLIILLLFSFYSCKQLNYKHQGEILSYDLRMCMCCGGTFIEIEGEKYRFYTLPEGSKINLKQDNLPLKVKLNFIKDTNQCLGDEIIIEDIVEN